MTDAIPHRQTRQRAAVSEALAGVEGFRTAQQVHALLRERGERVALATVYRNLQAMAEAGEVDSVRTPDGLAAYRCCAGGHHHHLICRRCGHTVEVEFDALERTLSELSRAHGFTRVDHEIELFGWCDACS